MAEKPISAPGRRARRRRDPDRTHRALLEAAGDLLSQDGKEGLSVVEVAQRAGVDRGTAYKHFQTREQLIQATAASVSEELRRTVFGDRPLEPDQLVSPDTVEAFTRHLAEFAMEKPELGRVWLFELLDSQGARNDPFWQQYKSNLDQFARTEWAQPGIDAEVVSVLLLAGFFFWPLWVRANTRTAKERQQMTERLTREILRLCLHGSMRPDRHAALRTQPGKADPA